MNAVLTVPAELCIDNRRIERKRSAGQKNLRRTSLDSAALLARHYCPSRRPAAVAENAADGQVSDTARRPPGTPRTPEHRGSSGLRSLDVAQRRFLPPQRPRPRRPPDPPRRGSGLTDHP